MNFDGGFRNRFTFCLTGLDIEAKAALVERTLWSQIPGGRESIQQVKTELVRTDRPDPETNEQAVALLRITVKDPDERKVGRAFSNVAIEMALASYPGMFGTGGPSGAEAYGAYWPALVDAGAVDQYLTFEGSVRRIPHPQLTRSTPPIITTHTVSCRAWGVTERMPLGRVVAARSGDKGGNANVGVWTRKSDSYEWLADTLTEDRIRTLLPEAAHLPIRIAHLPNLCALNIVLVGLLEEGVAASTRFDGQAKGLGEWLRARFVDVPKVFLKVT
jgi:hypothetical protein